MDTRPHARFADASAVVTRAASTIVVLAGSVVLLGWLVGAATLKSLIPGRTAMNPTTALCFILCGISLGLQPRGDEASADTTRLIPAAAAAAVALVGAVTLVGYVVGHNLGVDQILFHARLGSNRIAPNTGINFLLIGLALLLLTTSPRRAYRLAQLLALAAAATALLSLVGYLYNIGSLYGVGSYIPMALNTALAFAVVALGLLCVRPDRGLTAIIVSPRAGGVALRRLLPAAVGIPIALGWLRLMGERAGLYGTEFGVSLLVVANVAAFAALIWWTAGSLDRADRRREQAEAARERHYREAEAARSQTRAVLDAVSEAVVFVGADGRIRTVNRPFTDLFGLPPDAVLGRSAGELRGDLDAIFADSATLVARLSDGATESGFTDTVVQERPQRRELEVFATPVHGADGASIGRLYAFRDVTHEREVERLKDERRRQLEQELARAAQIQAALLPTEPPTVPGFELAARCLPAREVGGDFFDWHESAPGCLTITLGDVMGKGMSAALLMATARAALEAVARQSPPATAVETVAAALERDLERSGSFITLFHAQANSATRSVEYVDAGHGHVFLHRAGGAVEDLPPRGLPLGILAEQTYEKGSVILEPGDALVIYSDGLIDARPDVGIDRAAIADRLRGAASAGEIVDRLVALAAPSGPLPDDLTVVVLRCRDE